MKKIQCLLIALLPLLSFAQADSTYYGINFEQRFSWEQIKERALKENRYIFVDCYATWCIPCKKMDIEVYPSKKVGDFFNNKFISYKAQMDTSKKDNDEVKIRYADAHTIKSQYKVNSYPTFLFFSPDGILLHQSAGGYGEDEFILLARESLDPQKQFYRLLDEFNAGKRDTSIMRQLAISSRTFGNIDLSKQIAKEYAKILVGETLLNRDNIRFIRNYSDDKKLAQQLANKYINSIKKTDLYKTENIQFIKEFTQTSKDRGFKLFYNYPSKINKIMGRKGFAEELIKAVITKDELEPIIFSARQADKQDLDWNRVVSVITKKYNKIYASQTVSQAKVGWYGWKKKWPEFCKSIIESVELSDDKDNAYYLNSSAWALWVHSDSKNELDVAVNWMQHVLILEPDNFYFIDTYSNLLYRVGKTAEAIRWEQKALQIVTEKKYENYVQLFQKVVAKMEKGEPTKDLY